MQLIGKMALWPGTMQRSSFSLFLSAIIVLSLVFYHIHQLRVELEIVHHRIFVSLRDLETKAVVADQYLEQRVADNLRRSQSTQLERETQAIQKKAAAIAEEALMTRISEMGKSLAQSNEAKKNASNFDELSILASVKEYVHNYITNDVPIEVKRWFTFISKQARQLISLKQDDPVLIKYIREQLLISPSAKQAPFKTKKGNYSDDIITLLKIFKNKTNGYFVEIGNNFTKSHILETDFGWSGVLIDKDPDHVKDVLEKNRKSWIVPTCLSQNPSPQLVTVDTIAKKGNKDKGAQGMEIICMPFPSLCQALNITKVDYLHLNGKGNELEAFKKFDLNKIEFQVIEIGANVEEADLKALKSKLQESKFQLYNHTGSDNFEEQQIFVKKA